ncbi:MAG: ABC transporter substrate-binding protein [Candidatus Limnocylindria bacterium]
MADRRHPLIRLAALLALMSLVVAACSTPGTTTPAAPTAAGTPTTAPTAAAPAGPTGTLTVAVRGDIGNSHPYLGYDIVSISYKHNVFDNLVEWDDAGKIVPGLAESWEVDGLNITFDLRKGIRFHNGDEFTAEDVKFSIEHMKDPDLASGSASNVAAIEEVRVVDANTAQIVLAQVDAQIFDKLANHVVMLPSRHIQSAGVDAFTAKPIGTGPFKFVSYTADDRVVMEANEDYWEGSPKGKPNVKELVFRAIPTAATRIAELRAGAVDIVQDLPPDQVEPLKSAGFQVVENKSPVYVWGFFNTTSEAGAILQDIRVRQAMNHAVDTETIIETVLGGHARQLAGGVTDLTTGYSASLQPFAYDPDRAKQLLTEAGFPNGFELEADISASQRPDVAQAVIAQLGEVGIRVTLNPLPTDVYNDRWISKQLSPIYFVTWNTFTHPGLLDLLAGCGKFLSSFCSEEAQPFLDQGGATLDESAQATAYTEAIEVFARDPFGLYLYASNALYGLSSKVQGWKPHGITVLLGTNATKTE